MPKPGKSKLSVQIPPQLPAVKGDRVHLQQVLLNLILNGMDAMDAVAKVGGQLADAGGRNGRMETCKWR